MATIASLNVALSADSARLKKDLGKADAATKKWGNKQKKTFGGVEKAVKRLGLAIAAVGFGAMIKGAAETSKQLKIMSTLTGISATRLQQVEPSLRRAGISTEKYGDIIKDVNDKMHDFQQTGGGPMLDFFEQIAPKVGITADAFAHLSGEEALQLYVSSLEKAGASQEQMTFYMEALASDSTMLLPLIRDNAAGMDKFALSLQEVLSKDVRSSLIGLSDGLLTLGVSVRNIVLNAFGPLLGVLSDAVEGWQMMVRDFPEVVAGLGILTGAVIALTFAMYANPIGLIVAAFAALVITAGYLYQKLSLLNEATGSWSASFALIGDAFGFEFSRMGAYASLFGANIGLVWNDIQDKFNIMLHSMRLGMAEFLDGFASTSFGMTIGMEGGNVLAADAANSARTSTATDAFVELSNQRDAARAVIDASNPFIEQIANILVPLEDAVTGVAASVNTPTLAGGGGTTKKKAKTKEEASIGEGLLDSIQASFSTALKDGDWKGFLEGAMDSFTSTVIDNFAEGLFKPLDDFLGGAIDSLMNSLNGSGGEGGGGGLFGSLMTIGSSLFGGFGAAAGGIVPTTPFSKSYADSVPTMLQPGELVVPVDQVGNFMNGGGGGGGQTFNINVSGDVSRQTRKEIVAMMPQIASGTNQLNKENGIR